jgi:hypothetical protein
MKKTLIFVSLVLFQNTHAQRALQTISLSSFTKSEPSFIYKKAGDVIWSDDFSDSTKWTIGTDGQGKFKIGNNSNPEVSNSSNGLKSFMGEMATTGTTASNGFAFFNGLQYILNKEVDVQNTWVQSKPIDLSNYNSDYLTLTFNQRYRAYNYDSTFFEISEDNGQTWVSLHVNEDVERHDPAVQNTILRLIPTKRSATTIIRFRWMSNSSDDKFGSGYGWMIDDVKLLEPYPEELSVSKVFTNDVVKAYDYYSTPLSQVSEMKYGAIVQNLGATPSKKKLYFELKLNNVQKFLDSTEISLNPGELDTFWLSKFYTPSELGTFSLKAYLEDTAIKTNNSITDEFVVTQNIYGHNYPTTGNLTFGFNSVNQKVGLGNIYECFNNQQLNGIQVQFGEGTKAETFVEVEFKEVKNNIQDNVPLGGTYYTIPTIVNTSTPTDIAFDNPIQLEKGKTYMVLLTFVQSPNANIRVKATSKGNDDESTVGYGPFGENNVVNYYNGWSYAPYISLNFDPKLNVNDFDQNEAGFTVFPNPADEAITIKTSILLNNASISILDLNGKELKSTKLSGIESKINSSDLISGVYFVRVSNGNISKTEKLIIKK